MFLLHYFQLDVVVLCIEFTLFTCYRSVCVSSVNNELLTSKSCPNKTGATHFFTISFTNELICRSYLNGFLITVLRYK